MLILGCHFLRPINKLEQAQFSEGYNELQFIHFVPNYSSLYFARTQTSLTVTNFTENNVSTSTIPNLCPDSAFAIIDVNRFY